MKSRLVIVIVAIGVLANALPALSQDTLDTKKKDPAAASLMSVVVPGSGHVYAGETWTGIVVFGVTIGAPILGARATNMEDLVFSDQDVNWFPFILGLSVGVGAWMFGIFDADNAAREYSQTHGLASFHIDLKNDIKGLSTLHIKMDPMIRRSRFDKPMYGMRLGINF